MFKKYLCMHYLSWTVQCSAWIDYVLPSFRFLVCLISKPDLIYKFAPVEHSTHTQTNINCALQIWVKHWIGMNWSIYYWTVVFKLINWFHICNRFVWAYVTYILWLRLAPAMHFKVCLYFYQFLRLMSFWFCFKPNKNKHNCDVST